MAKTNPSGLTDKMFLFCQEYIKRGFRDATGAYRAAYPKCSENSAAQSASRTLKTIKVSKFLGEVQEKAAKDVQIDAKYVMGGLKKEAERTGKRSAHSARVRAYELLGKTQGLFVERVEHSGVDGGPIEIKEIVIEIPKAKKNDRSKRRVRTG